MDSRQKRKTKPKAEHLIHTVKTKKSARRRKVALQTFFEQRHFITLADFSWPYCMDQMLCIWLVFIFRLESIHMILQYYMISVKESYSHSRGRAIYSVPQGRHTKLPLRKKSGNNSIAVVCYSWLGCGFC